MRDMLQALRRRHDLSRFEYTRIVRIVPGGDTFSHPMLTLGNRFAENEDTAALHLPARADALVSVVSGHAGARSRRALLRRAGAALPGGSHRAARRRAQLRGDLPAPRHQLARGGGHRRVHRPRVAPSRWPTCSAAIAGSTAPCCGTGTRCRSSTSGTAWCRSAARQELIAENAKAAKRGPQRRRAKKSRSSAPARTSSIPP